MSSADHILILWIWNVCPPWWNLCRGLNLIQADWKVICPQASPLRRLGAIFRKQGLLWLPLLICFTFRAPSGSEMTCWLFHFTKQTDPSSLRSLAISQVDHGDSGIILSSYIRQCHCQNLSLLNYFNISKSICWSSGYFSWKAHIWPYRISRSTFSCW